MRAQVERGRPALNLPVVRLVVSWTGLFTGHCRDDGGTRMALRGRVLGGRYELQSLVATGGMGEVWRAHDFRLQRPVAVKVVGGGVTADPTFRIRFRAEAQHAALLNHPNIAAVHDYGEEPGGADGGPLAYLVMELVDGEPLSALLTRTGRLGVQKSLDVVGQTASALAAAHAAGVVHRDVKPANVLVRRDGVVKITDFGIAWSAASAAVTRTGQVIGTAHYLSPEQADGAKATPASDVYALGLVLHECLTGRRAFEGDTPVQIALKQIQQPPPPLPPDVPGPVRDLVARATAKDPARRLPNGAAVRNAVDDVLATLAAGPRAAAPTLVDPLAGVRLPAGTSVLPATAGAVGVEPDAEPARRRRGPLMAALAAAAVVGVALVAVAVASGGRGSTTTAAAGAGARTTSAVPTTPSSTSAAATTPSGIALVSAQWVGRPHEQVKDQLAALGLQVRLVPVPNGTVPDGHVTDVDPSGQLTPGSTVTVSYAVPPAPAPARTTTQPPATEHGKPKKHGKGKDD